MDTKEKYSKHYEESTIVNANAKEIFAYADDHANFSSHMNKSSWMMAGSKMETKVDEGKGQKVGSHIKMSGKILGFKLFLDEVITVHNPTFQKEWQTVGKLKLLIIDHYRLGFKIEEESNKSKFKVYIDYNLPQSFVTRLLGYLLGGIYAKWCVKQMTKSVKEYFTAKN